MIIYSNRFTKKHVIGGSGIIDTLRNMLKKAASSSASKSSLSLMKKMASSELGREAITDSKSAGKELASSAISTAKDVAIDKGKKTIAKVYSIAKPASSAAKTPIPAASDSVGLTKKSKDILSEMISGTSDKRHRSLKSEEPNSLGSYESMFGGSLSFATKPRASVRFGTNPSASVARTVVPTKPASSIARTVVLTKKISRPVAITKENAIRIQDLVKGRGMMMT